MLTLMAFFLVTSCLLIHNFFHLHLPDVNIGFGYKESKLVTELHDSGYYSVFVPSISASSIWTLNKELLSLCNKGFHPVVLINARTSADGWDYEAFSASELAKYGVELPAAAWDAMNGGVVVARRISGRFYLQLYDDSGETLSLIPDRYELSEYGSFVVTSEAGIGWTIVVEGSELGIFSQSSPSMLRAKRSYVDMPLDDGVEQESPSVTFNCGKVMKVLYCPFHPVGKLLCFAGEKVYGQIGAAITNVFGVGFSGGVANHNAKILTHFDYVKIGAYALGCLLIICSWMLKATLCGSSLASSSGAATSAKAKRCKKLSHLMASGAIICTALGVFCNILAPLPLPYTFSAISICVVLMLLAAFYGSF